MFKRAFTLIEVMVVLSILAIIAILGYNFFGSMVKDARLTASATQLHNIMVTLSAAVESYEKDNGGDISALLYVDNSQNLLKNGLLNGGYLKSWPMPMPDSKDPDRDATCTNIGFDYGAYITSNIDIGGDGQNDARMALDGISADVCKKFRELYQGDSSGVVPDWYYVNLNRPLYECVTWECSGYKSHFIQAVPQWSDH